MTTPVEGFLERRVSASAPVCGGNDLPFAVQLASAALCRPNGTSHIDAPALLVEAIQWKTWSCSPTKNVIFEQREHTRLNCSLCETRKEKRFCPALHARICAACCGTHRELILDCPSDCSYFKQARGYDRFRPELFEDERWYAHVQVDEDFAGRPPRVAAGFGRKH